MSNLYLIERNDRCGYDEYDSAVVVADSEEEAKTINPDDNYLWDADVGNWYGTRLRNGERLYVKYHSWVFPPSVTVTYLGEAESSRLSGEVICASFNAG
jgi:hypothetical protein